MTARATPGFGTSAAAMIRLSFLRTLRGRKLRVAAVASLVILLFPAVVAVAKDDADAVAVVSGGIDWGFYRLLVFLLPLLFASGAIGEEVEARTLHFLAMRPIERSSIALGKYIVGAGAALAILWAGLILLHVVGYATNPTEMIDQAASTARAGGALTLLLLNYCAVALFWGTLVPEAGGILTVVWLGVVEWLGMLLPGVLRFVSMAHFARELGGIERAADFEYFAITDVANHWCALAIFTEFAVFLGLALLTMHFAQLRFGKA